MAFTSPRTWVALENVSASIMNTHVRDDIAYLFNGRDGIMVYGTTVQAFTASTPQKLTHTTTAYTRGSAVSYSSGDITAAVDGVYAITAGIRCFGSGVWSIKLLLGGTDGPVGEGSIVGASVHWTIGVAAGAVFQSWAQTTVTATMSSTIGYSPFFTVQLVA